MITSRIDQGNAGNLLDLFFDVYGHYGQLSIIYFLNY